MDRHGILPLIVVERIHHFVPVILPLACTAGSPCARVQSFVETYATHIETRVLQYTPSCPTRMPNQGTTPPRHDTTLQDRCGERAELGVGVSFKLCSSLGVLLVYCIVLYLPSWGGFGVEGSEVFVSLRDSWSKV